MGKNNSFYIYGIKVIIGNYGTKIFTRDEAMADRISHYLISEGFKLNNFIFTMNKNK